MPTADLTPQNPLAEKVLVIGWDAADWKVIDKLIAEQKMPNLAAMIQQGVRGNMRTLTPVLSPMLWTSIGTGKRPFKHGVHGFSEPDPHTGGVRPITNLSRRCKAVWNILHQAGKTSNVVGWWPSHPAEPIRGVMVSNHFQQVVDRLDKPWPVKPGSVYPPTHAEKLKEFRVHIEELTGEDIALFIPKLAEIDQEKDRRPFSCGKIIAEISSVHATATALMQLEPWDFMAVYYDGIDHFGHGFMKYHPPRQPHISEEDFEKYQHVIESGYRYHDLMLGALLSLAGDDTTVILMSDHGFHSDHLRPSSIPVEPAGPAAEHRDHGIFVMKGPHVKRGGEEVFGLSVMDLCPTVLTLFGLPIGADMDGKPAVTAFADPPLVRTVPSWDEIEGDAGMHPPDKQLDPVEAREGIQQLVDLGYIDPLDENREKAVAQTVRELRYNLARSYMDAGRHAEAAQILRELWDEWPEQSRFGVQLLQCVLAFQDAPESRRIYEQLIERKHAASVEGREKLREKLNKLAEDYPQPEPEDAESATEPTAADQKPSDGPESPLDADARDALSPDEEAGVNAPDSSDAADNAEVDTDRAQRRIDWPRVPDRDKRELRHLRAQAGVNHRALALLGASVAEVEGDQQAALTALRSLENSGVDKLGLNLRMGGLYLKLRSNEEALARYQAALERESENPAAQLGAARALFRLKRWEEAADAALRACELMHFQPSAHALLGVALYHLGRTDDAIQALRVAVRQNPDYPFAHRYLSILHGLRKRDPVTAERHLTAARQARRRLRDMRQATSRQALLDKIRASSAKTPATTSPDTTQAAVHAATSPKAHLAAQPASDPKTVVTLVSGLPRSGTSLMMQMLQASGMPLLVDAHRPADTDNPKGYFEYEPVRSLRRDASWVPEARGKAIKVIAQLLPYLPPDEQYRVLFLERDLAEIVASQKKMLARLGRRGAALDEQRLWEVFRRQVATVKAWLGAAPNVRTLFVPHHEAVHNPLAVAERVTSFLGHGEPHDVAAVVDPSLHRQHATEPDTQREQPTNPHPF